MRHAFRLKRSIRLDRLFHTYRKNPALVTPCMTQTFGDIGERIRAVLFNLDQAGVRKGNRVALYGENSELHLCLFLCSWIMDFLYIPLDFKAPLSGLLQDLNIDFLVAEERAPSETAYQVIPPLQIMKSRSHADQGGTWPAIPFFQEASAIFTSGSTGRPRGIVHTVGNYIYSALGTNEFIALDTSDRWLMSLPLFHVGGALIWVRTLLSGSACILPDSLQNIGVAICRFHPTVISLVPAQLLRLLEDKEAIAILKRMKTIMLGGAPTPPWLIDQSLNLGLPIMPTYGCTESCAQVTGVGKESARQAYHTAGRLLPYRDLRIDSNGDIELGGKTLFKRFLHEPGAEPLRKGRFFKTADAGSLDGEGNLVVHGRTDGLFISGGENISPREIEHRLLALPGVITAMVVPAPHREFGMTPWAFVETTAPFDENRLLDGLRRCLPGYKLPKRIIRLAKDDREGKMKYSREALTARAAAIAEGDRGA